MFDDDWAASQFIYPPNGSDSKNKTSRPPITLLVMAVGDNIIFDPSKEELAVADCALAVSVGETDVDVDDIPVSVSVSVPGTDRPTPTIMDVDVDQEVKTGLVGRGLRLLSVRTIDPPSRLTAPGVPNAVNAAAWGHTPTPTAKETTTTSSTGLRAAETGSVEGVWKAPRGGTKIALIGTMVQKILESGGVAYEVLEALDGVELA
jgi:exosome complex component RRP42